VAIYDRCVDLADSATTPRRTYNSTRRRQNAAQTRQAIVHAARDQFLQRGWHGAAMRDIARDAGVAVETVYSNFSSKAVLFKEVLNVLVVGDDQPIALSERPEYRAVTAGPLPVRIEAMARMVADVQGRVARLRMVLREAARADDELAETERTVAAEEREQTRLGLQWFVPDPSDSDIEGWQAICSSDVYVLLTEVRGWTTEQYVRWISEITQAALAAKGVV
jgi:AcrR family transcriptional regulator